MRKGAEMRLDGVRWEGLNCALPAPGLISAITEADLVVFAESSPIASILPILELPGVREALAATKAVRVARKSSRVGDSSLLDGRLASVSPAP